MSVIGKAFWHYKGIDKPLVKCVDNIESCYSDFINKNGVFVDNYIAQFISDLNDNGLITSFSCSGLESEHKKKSFYKCPYFGIQQNKNKFLEEFLTWIKDNISNVKIECSDFKLAIYLSPYPYNTESDEIIKDKWNKIHKGFLELIDNQSNKILI